MRVPGNTSPKIKECMAGDTSKVTFASCLKKVVEENGGKADHIWFELNGTMAHAHVEWETVDQKTAIVFDLQADDVIDVLTPLEVDQLAQERGGSGT